MSLTLEEIKDRLRRIDEITLLEVLNLNSEDLVERFEDRILERLTDDLVEDLEGMDGYTSTET